jgi:voltage-gated potassium channel
MNIRKRVYDILDPDHHQGLLSKMANGAIYSLIFLNVVIIVLESVPSICRNCLTVFWYFEVLTVVVFSVEYLLRLWCCVELPKYASPVWGRLKYLCSFLALIDLLAILPFYLPFVTSNMLFLRAARFFRLFRLAKLGRYSSAFRVLYRVVYAKRAELFVSMFILFILTVLSAIGMYYAEHEAQPQVFPDVPSSMFWAIATLTNMGHPDPATPWGKLVASLVFVLGLAMLALPTGVLGAGFVEEFQSRRQPMRCPHCGKEISSHETPAAHSDYAKDS